MDKIVAHFQVDNDEIDPAFTDPMELIELILDVEPIEAGIVLLAAEWVD